MRLKFWGARGSLATPTYPDAIDARIRALFRDFFASGYRRESELDTFLASLPRHRTAGYGGNTLCIEITHGEDRVLIDGGSGIRQAGYELMAGPCGQGKGEVHLLFTHFHWDHIVGLPFFTPIFIPGNTIHVYAVQEDLPDVFGTIFRKPYFPVPLENLGARIVYHRIEPRAPISFGSIRMTPYQLDHPDPCWGYRVEAGGKVFSHVVDTECIRGSRQELGPDLPLYQGVDLMSFDAQYTLMEALEKVNWGHAAASLGLDIAMREGIKRVIFMHYDPASSDEKISMAAAQARSYYDGQIKPRRQDKASGSAGQSPSIHPVQWEFAYDGMTVDL